MTKFPSGGISDLKKSFEVNLVSSTSFSNLEGYERFLI